MHFELQTIPLELGISVAWTSADCPTPPSCHVGYERAVLDFRKECTPRNIVCLLDHHCSSQRRRSVVPEVGGEHTQVPQLLSSVPCCAVVGTKYCPASRCRNAGHKRAAGDLEMCLQSSNSSTIACFVSIENNVDQMELRTAVAIYCSSVEACHRRSLAVLS